MRPYTWCLLAAALCALPASLTAQTGYELDTAPPTIAVSPGSSLRAADSVRVTVTWSDNQSLDPGSVILTLGTSEGQADVSGSFVYSGTAQQAASVGTLRLKDGLNVLHAEINDVEGNGATPVEVTYTYHAPELPPDTPSTPVAPNYGVSVTPRGGGDTLVAGAGASATAQFTVTNTGNVTTTFAATGTCASAATASCVGATRDTLALAAGESRQVGVLFTAKATAGAVGQMVLTVRQVGNAALADSGWVVVRIAAAGSLGAATQQRPYLDRGECVVASLGGGAAAECGDLRLAHALPATRTLNRPRAPVLLYNSGHASPRTIQATSVTNTSGLAWDSVGMAVRRGGVVMATGRWPGWADASPRRVAVAFSETALPATAPGAAVYRDTLVVSYKRAGGWTQLAVVPSTAIVVDRRGSPFGSGWWMAGLEQVYFLPTNSEILWVGGDGSARVYVPVAERRWASAEPDAPDTIVQEPVTPFNGLPADGYVRLLPGKGRVAFAANGVHLYTRNRLGQTTWFFHDGANRLTQVALPTAVPNDTTYSYWFSYNSAAGTLGQVVAPHVSSAGDRTTRLVASGAAGAVRVTRITDFPGTADSLATGYAYDSFGRDTMVTAPGTLTRTRFTYGNWRVIQASSSALTNGHVDTVTVAISPLETHGVANAAGSAGGSTAFYTSVNGPLPGNDDVQTYWVDGNWRIKWIDTPGRRTQLFREDPRYPALVTTTRAPNGHRVTAAYDARGRLSSQTGWNPLDDGRNATTLYTWDDGWDEPASITTPTGITTTFGYDARGLREWEQVGPDPARRVSYGYNPQGQVTQVRSASAALRGEAPETLGYDPAVGNLVSTTTPLGIQTVMLNDRIGRVLRVTAPMDTMRSETGNGPVLFAVDSTVYDLAGRVRETLSWGGQQQYLLKMDGYWHGTFESTLHVQNTYDEAGRLVRVERRSQPDTAHVGVMTTGYEYDGFNRKTADVAADGRREVHHYDLAGRDTLTVNRRGEPVRMRYDARGNLLSRAMAGDSSSFTYDAFTDALRTADNAYAHVHRGYFPNGALRADTLHVATEAGQFIAGRHQYATGYQYDLEGRRTALVIPDSVRPYSSQGTIRYDYDAATGALAQITGPLGGAYTFHHRADGAVDTMGAPGTLETHAYDADGRMTVRERSAGSVTYRDSLWYDLRGKTVLARVLTGHSEMAYDGLGHLVHSFSSEWTGGKVPESEEQYLYDAVGNKAWHRRTSYALQTVNSAPVYPTVEYYAPGTARDTGTVFAPIFVGASAPPSAVSRRTFDETGSLVAINEVNSVKLLYGATTTGGSGPGNRTAYAEPDGTEASSEAGEQSVYTTYQYRPDGKLVSVGRAATCIYMVNEYGQPGPCTSQVPAYSQQDRTEQYRYDALGRRVWVKTVTALGGDGGCAFRCDNTTRRTVWDGDQVLAEIRYPNAQGEQDSGLDSVNVAAKAIRDARSEAGSPYGGPNTSDWAQHGRTLYIHGGGMDAPLGLIRMDYSYDRPGPWTIVPHASWRGTYETASFTTSPCTTVELPAGEVAYQDSTGHMVSPAEGSGEPLTQTRCVEIDFPGKYQGMTRLLRRQTISGPVAWMGSLMQDAQDASGLMFRRNRYYDPASGRFTQEDPIGLAGGVNAYGFADGDPVSFTDPSGLCLDGVTTLACLYAAVEVGAIVQFAIEATAVYIGIRSIARNGIVLPERREPVGAGSTGGPTAGRRATPREREAARRRNAEASGGVEHCVYCGVETTRTPGKPNSSEIDHVQPRNPRDGGPRGNNEDENLKNSCRACNRGKSNHRTVPLP